MSLREFGDRERADLYRLQDYYLHFESWTPAMGAMLLAGIQPKIGAVDISEPGIHIVPSIHKVGPSEILDANRTFKAFLSDLEEGDSEPGKLTMTWGEATIAHIHPNDFMYWCFETYETRPAVHRPIWYAHWWVRYDVLDKDANVPSPYISGMIDLVKKRGKVEKEEYVARIVVEILKPGGKLPNASVIARAVEEASDPRSPSSVFNALIDLAKTGKEPNLKYDDTEGVLGIRGGGRIWRIYKNDRAIQQLLIRCARAAGING